MGRWPRDRSFRPLDTTYCRKGPSSPRGYPFTEGRCRYSTSYDRDNDCNRNRAQRPVGVFNHRETPLQSIGRRLLHGPIGERLALLTHSPSLVRPFSRQRPILCAVRARTPGPAPSYESATHTLHCVFACFAHLTQSIEYELR